MYPMQNLAAACKVLLDREYLELRREHELLKKEYYISLHRVPSMVRMIRKANMYSEQSPRCVCRDCFYCSRTLLSSQQETLFLPLTGQCRFAPWMTQIAQSMGVTTKIGVGQGETVSTYDPLYGRVASAPVHIVFINGKLDWDFFAYGKLVTDAQGLEQIQPLVNFIEYLKKLTIRPYRADLAYRYSEHGQVDVDALLAENTAG